VSFREIVLIPDAGTADDAMIASARTLVDKARGGAVFAQLAAESSQVDPGVRGTVLGPFLHGELAPELERVVFTMKPGEISDPILVGGALHIVRIEGREDSVAPSLDAIKDKLVDAIERGKFDAKLDEYLKSLWENSKIHVADEYMQRLPLEYRKYVKD
jgi:peptidyl-prolyl cis-trans isomerase C